MEGSMPAILQIEAVANMLFEAMFVLVQLGSLVSLFILATVLGIRSIIDSRTVNYWYSFLIALSLSIVITAAEFYYLGGI